MEVEEDSTTVDEASAQMCSTDAKNTSEPGTSAEITSNTNKPASQPSMELAQAGNQCEPPHVDMLETIKLQISIPIKIEPIDLSMPLPVTRLEFKPNTLSATACQCLPPSWSRQATPLSYSRIQSRWSARRQILSRIGIQTYTNEKRLLAAVRNNDLTQVTRLLQEGVNPNVSDGKKRTPLHIAASQGLDHIASSLTSVRADPNQSDILGNTPLHLAATRGDTSTVRILIGSGADIHLKDSIGRTPLDIVKSRLNTLRRDRSISTEKLIRECQMICDVLKAHSAQHPYKDSSQVDALCSLMASMSTREQANQFADIVVDLN